MRTFVIACLIAAFAASGASAQPALRSLVIEPAKATVDEGATMVFVAIATYSNGVRKNVSDQVKWSSGDGKVATVAADGTVQSVAHGTVRIKAAMGKISARANLTIRPRLARLAPVPQRMPALAPAVPALLPLPPPPPPPPPPPEPAPAPDPQPQPALPAVLQKIVIEPETESLNERESRRLKAWGRYSDGTVRDITEKAVWSSSDIGVARADYEGYVRAVRHGTATVAATLDTYSGVATMTVLPVMARIVIRPSDFSMRHRARERLRAVAIFTDDRMHDITDRATWTSSDERVVPVGDDGSIEGVAPGTATITATLDDFTASTVVTVEAMIESIAIQPQVASLAVGQAQQLGATATFSDGSTKDVTSTVRWSSDLPAVRVSPLGMITGMTPGSVMVRARVGEVEGTARVDVIPPPS